MPTRSAVPPVLTPADAAAAGVGAPSATAQVTAPQGAAPAIKLTYRTPSDRLNVGGTQLAAFRAGGQPPLAACSTTTLALVSPHPRGRAGFAEATIVTRPDVAGQAGMSEVWVLDVPQWQAEAIVAKLRAAAFFERSKALGSEIFLAAEVGPEKISKNFRAVPELDALILRSRTEGRLVFSTLSTVGAGPGTPTPPTANLAPPAPVLPAAAAAPAPTANLDSWQPGQLHVQ